MFLSFLVEFQTQRTDLAAHGVVPRLRQPMTPLAFVARARLLFVCPREHPAAARARTTRDRTTRIVLSLLSGIVNECDNLAGLGLQQVSCRHFAYAMLSHTSVLLPPAQAPFAWLYPGRVPRHRKWRYPPASTSSVGRLAY
jgi:hypothetical protein